MIKMAKKPYADSRRVHFLETRLLELKHKKTQAEIAKEAGFINPNMVAMIKQGATKLPIDRVPALAKALDSDPALLRVWPSNRAKAARRRRRSTKSSGSRSRCMK